MPRVSHFAPMVALLMGASLFHSAWADDKKSSDKPRPTPIIIQIDASKLPPGLLKQLLQYAEPPSEKKPETKPKASTEGKPKTYPKEERTGKPAAKKPNIVQLDLNQLSPELRKRLEAELGKGKPKKDHDDDDDDDSKRPGKAKKDDDQGKAKRDKRPKDD